MTPAYRRMKRTIDVGLASIGLLVLAPIQLVIAVLVRIKLGSPVLFRQARPGMDEVMFDLAKFRTMAEPDPDKGIVSDADRLTRFGSFLRSTSLDELPSLWNVIKGEMSLVGPRPLLPQYLERYSPEQRRRHEVRPGITGLAQVAGRNDLSWVDKFVLDVHYVDNASLMMDVRIVARTLGKVIRREGIAAEGQVTMSEFEG